MINLITLRNIEANIASALICKFEKEVGHEKAIEIAAETIREQAETAGRGIAEKAGCTSLMMFADVVKNLWSQDDALEIEFIKETSEELFFNVRRCRYCEMYKDAGLADYGYTLSCNRDMAFVQGFNPDIIMKRTQTIMEGAPYCDFRFYKA